jgi:dolichol-phosphate mannosyltransferase
MQPAYVAVFDHARSIGARIAMTVDADFSHRPQDTPAVVRAALRPGVDLAIGSRYVPGGDIVGWPQSRKVLSAIANRLIRASLRTSTHDCTASFRAYSMELIDRLDLSKLESTGYSALPELLLLIDAVAQPSSRCRSHSWNVSAGRPS